VAWLFSKIALERFGLLDMEGLEVLVPGKGFEPGDRLRYCVYGLLAVTLGLGKIGKVPTLYPLVCSVNSSSLLAFDGVTIHVGLQHVSYAWSCLCDRDFQIAAHCLKLLQIDPPIDHAIAVRAYALQRAGGVAGLDAVGHLSGGHLRRAAREAVDTARPAGLLRSRPPVGEKAAKFFAPNQRRPLIVNGL
jgi:hypothetical protein